MAERIIMPKQGLQMTEGTIVEWLVPEGGVITAGEPLFTIETDKVTITIDALVSGTLLKIIAGPGTTVPITALIGVAGNPGEDISALTGEAGAVPAPAASVSTAAPGTAGGAEASRIASTAAGVSGRVFISPRARMKAEERGIPWQTIRGSGPGGMVVERDIAGAAAGLNAASAAVKATPLAAKIAALAGVDLADVQGRGPRGKITRADVEAALGGGAGSRSGRHASSGRTIVPMRGMRKIIAGRMKQSQNENAQTSHRIAVRMDEAVRVRMTLNKAVGYNDLIAMAAVRALRDFPAVNAELTPEGIWQKDFVNLGVAVALDSPGDPSGGGLIVPVVKDADLLSLGELAAAIKTLAEKARSGGLEPDEYSGGTFTLSNLGMFGLEEFTAIINPPEAGILAVGKIEDTPVAAAGPGGPKTVEIHPVMKLTLSYDHRIVDGAPAARFLSRIKEYLEEPYKLL
ncbi:MAG: 2-oxo acid dehydrogenase subunit E2 [Treponema sp.]|jgi:pyruvate dehydrogenase E2 component (dihydrolipoamide acetyltransferase)|nr:2-oxo acid dehydrogenase subunit E2 [Treponema sp.]